MIIANEKKKPEKNQRFNGIRTRDLPEKPVQRSTNWAMKPQIRSEVTRSEMMWSIYESPDFFPAFFFPVP